MSERLFTQAEVDEIVQKRLPRLARQIAAAVLNELQNRRGDVKPTTFNEGKSHVGS